MQERPMDGSRFADTGLAPFELPRHNVELSLSALQYVLYAMCDLGVLMTERLWRGEVVTTQTSPGWAARAASEAPLFGKRGSMARTTKIARLLLVLVSLVAPLAPAHADIDSQHLGARYDATTSNITFRVFSSRATRVEVELFAVAYGAPEVAKYVLTKDASNIWSVTVPVSDVQAAGITGAVFYGYRAWGPNWPYDSTWTKGSAAGFVADVDAAGNRFNPNKLLFDPYALELSHNPINPSNTDPTVFASGASYRLLDSGPNAPKGIVLGTDTSDVGTKPTRAQKDDIIYEVHVRGLTENDPGIPAAYRGTYRGAALKAGDLASLGVTAVEFLPVQETQNAANDVTPNSTAGVNYWGYATLNYFAPDRHYASD
ncbi:MAG TPA: hypothetical protein VKI44_34625, partial [Acetobacteraceae bacterium]|nr:hypothetical protein [Acetobacteraceae bacterium]